MCSNSGLPVNIGVAVLTTGKLAPLLSLVPHHCWLGPQDSLGRRHNRVSEDLIRLMVRPPLCEAQRYNDITETKKHSQRSTHRTVLGTDE